MEEFLAKLVPLWPRTRENVRLKCAQFFTRCVAWKWIAENPAAHLAKKVGTEEVEILSVQAAEKLLRTAQESEQAASVLPYLAVSLFAWLRPGAAQQLRWENIHFDERQLEVTKSISKTQETRFITLETML